MTAIGATPSKHGRARVADDVSFLHEAALTNGIGCTLLTNRVLLVDDVGDGTDALCFAKGMSPSTSQAAAATTFEQDLTRHILRDQGVPVPEWATLLFTDIPRRRLDASTAIASATARIGFPLITRGAWGAPRATGANSRLAVRPDELHQAIEVLRKHARPKSVNPHHPRARFMVERFVADTEIQALVVQDEIIATTRRSWSSGTGSPDEFPAQYLHDDVRALILQAIKVIPDLRLATVRVVLNDPADSLARQPHAVTSLRVSPSLVDYEATASLSAVPLAWEILVRSKPDLETRRARLGSSDKVDLTIGGLSSDVNVLAALDQYIQHAGVTAEVRPGGEDGELGVKTAAGSASVVALCDDLLAGKVGVLRPLYAKTDPT